MTSVTERLDVSRTSARGTWVVHQGPSTRLGPPVNVETSVEGGVPLSPRPEVVTEVVRRRFAEVTPTSVDNDTFQSLLWVVRYGQTCPVVGLSLSTLLTKT